MGIVLLGSTGSIGTNTLELCERHGIEVEALVAGRNTALLNEQIARFNPRYVAVAEGTDPRSVNHPDVRIGKTGIDEILEACDAELVVNALVGYAGLHPTLKALELGKRVALANKESLVIAGALIDTSRIFAIDSEHFGLWFLQNGKPFRKLFITASGGALRDWEIEAMRTASFDEALKHPNWSMGAKITIDSATMTNKLFELLEACWLFGTTDIDAVIERTSQVHALVEFVDGSTAAHIAGVDMKLPIAYALGIDITQPVLPPIDPLEMGAVRFEAIEEARYPVWQIRRHLLEHPHLGVVVNAANEVAIEAFKEDKCGFFEMSDAVLDAYRRFDNVHPTTIEEIVEIDEEVRRYVGRKLEMRK